MSRNFTINVYPEPIEFSLTFDGDTSDPTVVYDKAVSMKNFLGKLKAAGWEVEKGTAAQVDPDETVLWAYELSEDSQAFDGDRGQGSKEDARKNALSALSFIMRDEAGEAVDIALKISQDFYRDIDGKTFKGHVNLIEKIDQSLGDHRFFIKGEDPHETYAQNGINVKFSQPFDTFDEAVEVFDEICASSKMGEYIDKVLDAETAPKEIPLVLWPETGNWCHKDDLANKLSAGSNQNYISYEFLEASAWNPKTERVERELDQGYYISIEVEKFIKDFKYVQAMDPQTDKEALLGRDYVYALKKFNEYQMKVFANKASSGTLEEKYQETLDLLKQFEKKDLRKDQDLSKQVDLCSKLYSKAKETNQKYYADRFVEEANKVIAYLNGGNKPVDLQSAVKSLNIELSPLRLK
jgi:hypothetical protein